MNEAEVQFKKALSYHPENVDYLRNYGIMLTHGDKGKEAEKIFKKIV